MPRLTTQAEVSNPQRKGYDFRLDNQLYRAAISPDQQMIIESSDVGAENAVNVKQNAEDFTSNIGRVFSRNNFSAGEGLDTAHRANGKANDVNRYWDSKNVDVFHDDETSYNVSLLFSTEAKSISLSGTNNYIAQTANGHLYLTDNTTIYKSTNNGSTWAAVSTGLTINYNFTGIAAFNNGLYLTTANGTSNSELIKFDGTSWSEETTAQTSSGGLNGVWFVKNRLFITGTDATATRIWSVSPFGKTWSSSDLADGDTIVSIESEHSVSTVIDGGAVVLAGATDSNVYSFKLVSGAYVNKGQTKIPFEEIYSMAASEGIIFLGTKEVNTNIGRFYKAEVAVADDLYVLGNRQLIKQWDVSGIDTSPRAMFVSRDSVYVGIHESSTECNLWRYYLPTTGLARDLVQTHSSNTTAKINTITQSNGKFVTILSGIDVYIETSTFASEGYVITSPADFFTAESKQFVGVEIETENLSGSDSVEVYLSNKFEAINDPDDSDWSLELNQLSGIGGDEQQLTRVARYITAKVVLKTPTNDSTPKFKSIQLRALARPELVVVQIPVNISDRVERPFRKPIKVKNLGETIYQSLKLKEGSSVVLEIYDPAETIRGVVEKVSYPIISNPNVGSVTQYAILTVRGTRQATFDSVTSGNILGVNGYAIMRFG